MATSGAEATRAGRLRQMSESPDEFRDRKRVSQSKTRAKQRAEDAEAFRMKRRTQEKAYRDRLKAADPEAYRQRQAEYQRRYMEKHGDSVRERRRARSDVQKPWLGRLYGLALAEYDAMLSARGGLCDICHRPETATQNGKPKALSVDHDHDTGAVRGLLRSACNRALGWLGDDPARVADAAAYLAGHKPVLRLVS